VGPRRLRPRAQIGVGRDSRRASVSASEEVVEEVKERLGDRPLEFTSDEHAAYRSAIVTAFSETEPAGPPAGPAPAAAGSGLGLCDGSQRAEEGTGRVHPGINCAGGRADRGGAA
jgi:hypothetical protein